MPPRARKTAASAPKAPEVSGDIDPSATATASADTPELFVPGADPIKVDEQPAPAISTVSEADAAELQSAIEPETPAASAAPGPPSPTYHWQQADGRPGDPCRLCTPAGPPAGAGSFGCAHGQWVLAPDGA